MRSPMREGNERWREGESHERIVVLAMQEHGDAGDERVLRCWVGSTLALMDVARSSLHAMAILAILGFLRNTKEQ